MRLQKGYFKIDLLEVLLGVLIIGIVIGYLLSFAVPWIWQLLKPFIHAMTA